MSTTLFSDPVCSITSCGPTRPTFRCVRLMRASCPAASARLIPPTGAGRSAPVFPCRFARPKHRSVFGQHLFRIQPAAPVQRLHALSGRSHSPAIRKTSLKIAASSVARQITRCRFPGIDRQRIRGRGAHAATTGGRRAPAQPGPGCRCHRWMIPPPFPIRMTYICRVPRICSDTPLDVTFRSVLGLRDDYQHGTDIDYLARLHETPVPTGNAAQSLLQPKGSLIYTRPNPGVLFERRPRISQRRSARRQSGHERGLGLPHTPLLAKQDGQEVGLRAAVRPTSSLRWASITYGNSPRPSSTRT